MQSEENVKFFRELNKGIKDFNRKGVTVPAEIQKYQRMVNTFYEKNNLKFARNQFTVSQKLSPEQQAELDTIANQMQQDSKVLFYQDYEDILNKGSFADFDQFGEVKTVDDVIKVKDKIESLKNDSALMDSLKYQQYADIIAYKNNSPRKSVRNLSEDDIKNMIAIETSLTGASGEVLQEKIIQELNDYGKRKRSKGQIDTESSYNKGKRSKF